MIWGSWGRDEALVVVTYFVELDDVGVSNFLQDFDFPSDPFHVLLVVDFLFLKDFDGHLGKK